MKTLANAALTAAVAAVEAYEAAAAKRNGTTGVARLLLDKQVSNAIDAAEAAMNDLVEIVGCEVAAANLLNEAVA